MRLSLFQLMSVPRGSTPEQALQGELEQMLLAEDLGFEGVWLAEHHFMHWGACPSPPTLLAYLAARTTRLRLGVAISVLPLHDPVRLAEEYALVDVLSGGRLNLGVGRGSHAVEYVKNGVPREESTSRLREALEVIRKAWTLETFSHHGEHYQYSDISLVPRPVQRPHPPLYVGGGSPDTGVWAAQQGAGAQWTSSVSYVQLRERREQYRQAARAAGRDPGETERILRDTPVQRMVCISEHKGEALREIEQALTRSAELSEMFLMPGEPHIARGGWEDQVARRAALVGTPEEVADQLLELQEESGYEHVMCYISIAGGTPYDSVKRTMRLLSERVMPRIQAARTAPTPTLVDHGVQPAGASVR